MAPINDAWASATILTGTSGSGSDDLNGATQEAGEPAVDVTASVGVGTVWFTYTPTTSGVFTFTATTTSVITIAEIWVGSTLAGLVEQGSAATSTANVVTVTAGLASGVPAYVRFYPKTVVSVSTPYSYTWTEVADAVDLSVLLVSDCDQSPGTMTVHVGNVTPGDNVYFTLDGEISPVLTLSVPSDAVGITVGTVYYVPREEQLLFVSVFVDETHLAGTHTLTVSSDVSGSAVISFQVLTNPLVEPVEETDSDIGTLPTGTTHWIFRNPVPGGETYIWEINPAVIGSPYSGKHVSVEQTTAADGQVLEWQGTNQAVSWQLSGILLSETQLSAFQRFAALDNRFWVTDHFGRKWVVTLEELYAHPRVTRDPNYPWVHDWDMTLMIWKGPFT